MPEARPLVGNSLPDMDCPAWGGTQVMATDTTLEAARATASDGSPALRQLWQVPTFLAGLLAVAGVCAALPLHKENPLSEMDRDIAAIRHVLEKPQASVA